MKPVSRNSWHLLLGTIWLPDSSPPVYCPLIFIESERRNNRHLSSREPPRKARYWALLVFPRVVRRRLVTSGIRIPVYQNYDAKSYLWRYKVVVGAFLDFVELALNLWEEFFVGEISCSHDNDILSNIVLLFILHYHIPRDILYIIYAAQYRQSHYMISIGCITLKPIYYCAYSTKVSDCYLWVSINSLNIVSRSISNSF